MLTFAGHELSSEQALQHLVDYSRKFRETIKYYDYDGDLAHLPPPSSRVTMSDVARLLVINARPSSGDVSTLLAPVDENLWEAVRDDLDFRAFDDDPRQDPNYQAVETLYEAFHGRKGLKRTKVTKLLALKRPGVVPIVDDVAERAYAESAETIGRDFGSDVPMYWAAIWRDARANDPWLADLVHHLFASGDEWQAKVGALAPLRLHDMIVWSHFHS